MITILANSEDCDEALICISSGSSLFAKVPVYRYPEIKGLSHCLNKYTQLSSGARTYFWSDLLSLSS